jgi:hypothetical protein
VPSPTDQIPVLRIHLEQLVQAIDSAYGFHTADDLARQFKNVGGTFRPSNLTKRLENALELGGGYLAPLVEDDEQPQV